MFFVYLLTPVNSLYAGTRSYVGFTINVQHRLRQHNREIKGGAKKTLKLHPWRLVCVVSGFDTKQAALKFEYMWQHPRFVKRSRAVMEGRVSGRPGSVKRKLNELERLMTLNEAENLRVSYD